MVWIVPATVVAIGTILVALRGFAAWQQAQALQRSLVAWRTVTPELEALRNERAALAAELQRITRK